MKKFLLVGIFLFCAHSEELLNKRDFHILNIISENDAYFLEKLNYDKYYTGGHFISYTSPEFENNILNKIAIFSHFYDKSLQSFNISLNQEIYSPRNKFAPAIFRKDDAPYGGYLYANIGIQNRSYEFIEQISLNIGLVGPNAYAREVQNGIHQITNNRNLSWENQIQNEFIFNFYYNILYRLNIFDNIFDISPNFVLGLGNANIYADFALRFRIGWGLNNDFGISSVRNKIFANKISDDFSLYLLGGVKQKIVGRNIFIQGNTLNGMKTDLKLENFVLEYEAGIAFGWKHFAISYLFIHRQKEFKTQPLNHNYGSIRLEFNF